MENSAELLSALSYSMRRINIQYGATSECSKKEKCPILQIMFALHSSSVGVDEI